MERGAKLLKQFKAEHKGEEIVQVPDPELDAHPEWLEYVW